jgi:hypothetical protein
MSSTLSNSRNIFNFRKKFTKYYQYFEYISQQCIEYKYLVHESHGYLQLKISFGAFHDILHN